MAFWKKKSVSTDQLTSLFTLLIFVGNIFLLLFKFHTNQTTTSETRPVFPDPVILFVDYTGPVVYYTFLRLVILDGRIHPKLTRLNSL